MTLPHRSPGPGRQAFVFGLALLALGTGCRLFQSAVDVPGQTVRAVTPGKKDKAMMDPVEVQQNLIRFTDEFLTRMIVGVDSLRHGTNALPSAEVLRWKIALATETCSIASGPNAMGNLLDMTVFVTVTRMALEEHWQRKVFGQSAQPIVDGCRASESDIWRFIGRIFKAEQQAELRQAIELWQQQNPSPENVLSARAVGLAMEVAKASAAATEKSGSVFNLLLLDPLSGLDPATREIAQTRLFAERALYVMQKMPVLLRWQTELLTANTVELPAVGQLVTNSTQLAASLERFARVAERLPPQFSAEREEILQALQSQEKQLTPLVNEVRQTLATGSTMSTSLNTTLTTFDALMQRFGVGVTNLATPPPSQVEPFRIQEYGQTAAQLEATARGLTELLLTLDRTLSSTNLSQLSAQINPAVLQAQASGKAIVDYAFRKSILLVIITLLATLIYRVLASRLSRPPSV